MAERHHLTLTLISARRRPSAEQTPFVAAGRLQQIAGIATKPQNTTITDKTHSYNRFNSPFKWVGQQSQPEGLQTLTLARFEK